MQLGKHTAGTDTRAYRTQGVALGEASARQLDRFTARIDEWIQGSFPDEEKDMFFKLDLPSFAETCLSSRCELALQPAVNDFFKKCHEVRLAAARVHPFSSARGIVIVRVH